MYQDVEPRPAERLYQEYLKALAYSIDQDIQRRRTPQNPPSPIIVGS